MFIRSSIASPSPSSRSPCALNGLRGSGRLEVVNEDMVARRRHSSCVWLAAEAAQTVDKKYISNHFKRLEYN